MKKIILKGFSLIELLTVIAIIAILAGIIFPVFSSAKEKARTTVCQSNLKQLALAAMMYADDNNKCYPPAYNSRMHVWTNENVLYYQYVKNREIFYCPDSPYTEGLSEVPWGIKAADEESYKRASTMNYTANINLMGFNNHGFKYTKVKTPANVIIVMDGGSAYLPNLNVWQTYRGMKFYYLPGYGKATGQAPRTTYSDDMYSDYMDGRHRDGINVVYCDGHSDWVSSADAVQWMSMTKQNPLFPKTW